MVLAALDLQDKTKVDSRLLALLFSIALILLLLSQLKYLFSIYLS
jgi:hypothetical protein